MKLINILLFAIPALGGPPSESDPFRGSISCTEYYLTGLSDANWEHCDASWWLDDSKFVPYDVYYNGTTVLQYTSYNNSKCHPTLWPANMSFAIGGMTLPSDPSISRSIWDDNQYYMSLDDPTNKTDCEGTALCFPRFETNSSSSFFYWGQYWTLDAVKSGDGFDISGNLTTTKAGGGTDLVINFPPGCPDGSTGVRYEKNPLVASDQVSMTGHVSSEIANVIFTISNFSMRDDGNGEQINLPGQLKFNFTGVWWSDGAGLITTEPYPSANGVKAKPPSKAHISGARLGEIIGGTIGGILFLAILACLYRKRRAPVNQPVVYPTPVYPPQSYPVPPLQYPPPDGPPKDLYTPPPGYKTKTGYASPISKYPSGYAPTY